MMFWIGLKAGTSPINDHRRSPYFPSSPLLKTGIHTS
jgi:hypothetical protein